MAVTASVDGLEFKAPIAVGDVVRLVARVNAVFRTSMEVEVRVEKEDPATRVRALCVDSLLTFVMVGEDGRPHPMPPLVLENQEDRARDAAARQRRAERLAKKQRGSRGMS